MARQERQQQAEPDVQVHHRQGCDLCGSADPHTHTQADWRELLDQVGERMGGTE